MGNCSPRSLTVAPHEVLQAELLQVYGLRVSADVLIGGSPDIPAIPIDVRFERQVDASQNLSFEIHPDEPVVSLKVQLYEQTVIQEPQNTATVAVVPPPAALRVLFGGVEVANTVIFKDCGVEAGATLAITWDDGRPVTIEDESQTTTVTWYPQEKVRCALARSVSKLAVSYRVVADREAGPRKLNGQLMEATVAEAEITAGARLLKGFDEQFTFDHSFDQNGVLYWLGTNQGTERYVNPHLRGEVVADCSDLWGGRSTAALARIVQNQPSFQSKTVTSGRANSWFAVDLGQGRAMVVDHYCIRHGFGDPGAAIRNWRLEGSHDGLGWVVLRRHVNAAGPRGRNGAADFVVHDVTEAYRHLRIIAEGDGGVYDSCFACSGMEFYGGLELQ